MPTFVQILDFIGTFAFAISGIRLASAKRFDWFGAYVVGFVTAIGGGTIRDLLLDVTPGWMTDPIYLICTGLALLWVIFFGKHLIHLHNTFLYSTASAWRCLQWSAWARALHWDIRFGWPLSWVALPVRQEVSFVMCSSMKSR